MMAAKTIEFITDALTVEKDFNGSLDIVCWACEESAPSPDAAFQRSHEDCKEIANTWQ